MDEAEFMKKEPGFLKDQKIFPALFIYETFRNSIFADGKLKIFIFLKRRSVLLLFKTAKTNHNINADRRTATIAEKISLVILTTSLSKNLYPDIGFVGFPQ